MRFPTRSISTVVAGTIAAAITLSLSVTAAQAAGPAAGGRITSPSAPSESQSFVVPDPNASPALISKWDPYVTLDGGVYVLTAPASVTAADPAGYADVIAVLARTNATYGSVLSNPLNNPTGGKTIRSSGPHGSFTMEWWGASIYLDHYATGQVTTALSLGAGVNTVAALIVKATSAFLPWAKAAAVALGLTGQIIKACDWNGNGVGLHVEIYTAIPMSWCWAR
ncbi:hypothetical protein [Cellulomonas sp. URHB0016]